MLIHSFHLFKVIQGQIRQWKHLWKCRCYFSLYINWLQSHGKFIHKINKYIDKKNCSSRANFLNGLRFWTLNFMNPQRMSNLVLIVWDCWWLSKNKRCWHTPLVSIDNTRETFGHTWCEQLQLLNRPSLLTKKHKKNSSCFSSQAGAGMWDG